MTKEHSEEKVKDVKIKLKSDYGNDSSVPYLNNLNIN